MFRCRWYALLLTRSVNTQLVLCEAWGWMLLVGVWMWWPGDGSCSRLTALLFGRLLGVCLLFTGAYSMGHAVQWSPMKPESELIQLVPLKSLSTCSCPWLHCDLQNMPREHASCTARTPLANRSASSSWLSHIVLLTAPSSRISLLMS
jgi:hypothetical protein